MGTPTLERIIVYPVKSLDPHDTLERVEIRPDGGLTYDRRFAMVDADGEYINGKNDQRVHALRSWFDPKAGRLTLRPNDGDPTAFDVENHEAIEAWLTDYFEEPVELKHAERSGFPDDTLASGPTIISRATLEEVAGWFDGIDADEMERRLRPNLIISGVEAFWEDRLYKSKETAVGFRIGDCELVGSNPCQRCVVPSRDPETGEETEGFRETFMQKREATLPEWASEAWFDHYYRLMVNTFVPEGTIGTELRVGDELEILDERPYPA
ncbi:MOSC N-terminal beta barrel domain-containing protein [Natronomonas halophila]|uniref:MOSC domain-containing protein n=1 Tax=Natronomonas halophila TaxID=2747817 RepID=UPI0015B77100|nr:MOSC N-terminal beta barrel domain-containing protein [Natronomonas halophila]QLD86772.1 MOSC N-terminal beta barrel domain-containing protein [Natronomonas halophila]